MSPDDEQHAASTIDEPLLASVGRLTAIVLAAAGAVALAACGRMVYSAWSGQRRFDTWPLIVFYYLMPATLAALCFSSLGFKLRARVRLLMLIASLTLSLYAGEAWLTIFAGAGRSVFASLDDHARLRPAMTSLAAAGDKTQFAADLTRRFGGSIDVRTSREMLDELRRQDHDAISVVTPSNHLFMPQSDGSIRSAVTIDGDEVLPLAGVSGRVTLLCNESGQWVDYRSDRRGFNNPDRVWDSRPIDIVALGDSFTHGYCVENDKSFVALIRDHDGATVNLGIAGDGPLLMLATLAEFAAPRSPNIVLWFYYEGNDLVDLQIERKSALLSRYLTAGFSQPHLARQAEVDHGILAEIPRLEKTARENDERRRRNVIRHGLTTFVALGSLRERFGLIEGSEPSAGEAARDFDTANMAVFQEVLRQAKTQVDGWKGQLYFVYLPEWTRYTSYSSWGKAKRDDTLRLVRSLGIPVIDVDPVFQAHGDPLSLFPFRMVGHYNETGHRLVAEEVLRRLASGGRHGSPW
ncbi:MAG: SGNH/GDSL hydrolase family protein [Acidobacteriota bacterium]